MPRPLLHLILPIAVTAQTLIAITAQSQRVIDISRADADVIGNERLRGLTGGSIFPPDKYIKIREGSPFYWDEWSTGSLVMENGTTFQHLELKLDLLNHEVHYKDANDREMILSTAFKQIILRPGLDARIFIPGKPWAATERSLANAWLQVLVNDSVSLLLDLHKKLIESTSYNSATTEQFIEDKDTYYLQKNGKLIRIPHWDDLFSMLGDKRKELTKYAREMNLTGEAPIEYAQLVAQYNKL
jgi:hypothetical protein